MQGRSKSNQHSSMQHITINAARLVEQMKSPQPVQQSKHSEASRRQNQNSGSQMRKRILTTTSPTNILLTQSSMAQAKETPIKPLNLLKPKQLIASVTPLRLTTAISSTQKKIDGKRIQFDEAHVSSPTNWNHANDHTRSLRLLHQTSDNEMTSKHIHYKQQAAGTSIGISSSLMRNRPPSIHTNKQQQQLQSSIEVHNNSITQFNTTLGTSQSHQKLKHPSQGFILQSPLVKYSSQQHLAPKSKSSALFTTASSSNSVTSAQYYFGRPANPTSKNNNSNNNNNNTSLSKSILTNLTSASCLDSYKSINETFSQQLRSIDQIESRNNIFSRNSHTNSGTSLMDQYLIKSAWDSRMKIPPSANVVVASTIEPKLIEKQEVNVLQCQINEFLYFKVRVSDEESPLRLRFYQGNASNTQSVSWSNVRLFVSRTCYQPNNFNADFACTNTKVLMLDEEKNSSHFSSVHPYFYFALVSDLSMDVIVKVHFGQEQTTMITSSSSNSNGKKISNNTMQLQTGSQSTGNNFNNTVSSNFYSDTNNAMRRDSGYAMSMVTDQVDLGETGDSGKMFRPPVNGSAQHFIDKYFSSEVKQPHQKDPESIVFKNIVASGQIDYFTKGLEVLAKKRAKKSHEKQVQFRADQQELDRIKEIEKANLERTSKVLGKILKFRRQFFVYFWIQIIKLVQVSDEINRRFMEKKEAIQNFSKLVWMALPLSNKFRNYRTKYPNDEVLNTLRYGYISMRNLARMIRKKRQVAAGNVLMNVLKYNQTYGALRARLVRYREIVISVQRGYRVFLLKKANFKKLLLRMFDKYLPSVFDQMMTVRRIDGESDQSYWKKKQSVFSAIGAANAPKVYAVEQYFSELMKNFRNDITSYLEMNRYGSKDSKRRIHVVQQLYDNSRIRNLRSMDTYNDGEDEIESLNPDENNNDDSKSDEQQEKPIATSSNQKIIRRPRLFIVPTHDSITSLVRIGIEQYITQYPQILDRVMRKQQQEDHHRQLSHEESTLLPK